MSIQNEFKLVNDCIKIINMNKNIYIPSDEIIDEIDNYYNKFDDIKDLLEDEFIRYVREKITNDIHLLNRYNKYGIDELKEWFNNEEFKKIIENKIRNLSNLEYYVYLTNKINKKKIKDLQFKLNYITLLFAFICLTNIFNHISIN